MTSTELAKLLYDNRVLIHNLLREDAARFRIMASRMEVDDTENKMDIAAIRGYAKFREDLAAKIFDAKNKE